MTAPRVEPRPKARKSTNSQRLAGTFVRVGKLPDLRKNSGMKSIPPAVEHHQFVEQLVERYGEVIGGIDLATMIGFRTADGLRKAIQSNKIGLKTFRMPGRPGHFALTREVAVWLLQLRSSAEQEVEMG